MFVSMNTSPVIQGVARPATLRGFSGQGAAIAFDIFANRLPGLGIGGCRGFGAEASVEGLTDQLRLGDSILPGAFFQEQLVPGRNVDLLTDHLRHGIHHNIHREPSATAGDHMAGAPMPAGIRPRRSPPARAHGLPAPTAWCMSAWSASTRAV